MRRKKLTKAEREKRQAKRERRAEVIPIERARERRRQKDLGFVECENCGLEQPPGHGMVLADGFVTVAPCTACGHLYAKIPERFS